MYVKYDENLKIASLFVGCAPDDTSGYIELPDDDAVIKAYIEANKPPVSTEATPEERIAALEEQLLAAKILLGVE